MGMLSYMFLMVVKNHMLWILLCLNGRTLFLGVTVFHVNTAYSSLSKLEASKESYFCAIVLK